MDRCKRIAEWGRVGGRRCREKAEIPRKHCPRPVDRTIAARRTKVPSRLVLAPLMLVNLNETRAKQVMFKQLFFSDGICVTEMALIEGADANFLRSVGA